MPGMRVRCTCGAVATVQSDGSLPKHKRPASSEWCRVVAGARPPRTRRPVPPPAVTAPPPGRAPASAVVPESRGATQALRTVARRSRVTCPDCGRSIIGEGSDVVPQHLDRTGRCPCLGSGRSLAADAQNRPPSTKPPRRQPAAAEKVVPGSSTEGRRERLTPIERRERRVRDRAFADLEVRPPSEDLDDSLFRARARRGGLPSLGRRR